MARCPLTACRSVVHCVGSAVGVLGFRVNLLEVDGTRTGMERRNSVRHSLTCLTHICACVYMCRAMRHQHTGCTTLKPRQAYVSSSSPIQTVLFASLINSITPARTRSNIFYMNTSPDIPRPVLVSLCVTMWLCALCCDCVHVVLCSAITARVSATGL